MHSLLHFSKKISTKFFIKKLINKQKFYQFCDNNKKINLEKDTFYLEDSRVVNEKTNNNIFNIHDIYNLPNNSEISKEEKTRKEEVVFYIMHDKFSVRPEKEYRINHTTVESTDLKTKMKDLNVLHYGNYIIL